MYKVTVTTHFEDWYVGDTDIEYFDTLEEAMNLFCAICKDGFKSEYPSLERFIAECCFDDDKNIDDWRKGFIVWIFNKDKESIIYQGFDYDPQSHSVEERSEIEFDRDLLTEEEIRVLLDLGYIL